MYAGWLGKVIGVRYGAPIEMWGDDRIKSFFGELDGYVTHFSDFAADDDTNGPLFFIRALEDYCISEDLTAEQIGITVLNYVPYEHGFFWWGGYGVSAEHTMYLNLRNGIKAPNSGSIRQNGKIMPTQIGGQIFIDTWGLVCPCDFKKAARYAQKAASIAWDSDGIYGGMFIAACISAAFDDSDVISVIHKALSVIPEDCEYAKTVRDIIAWYSLHPDNWRDCLAYVKKNYWVDKYIGNCHIIPNSAIIVLALLYGEGNFKKSLNICNMCGFDTDCNVGNIGTILGVLNGLDNMDLKRWFAEINDFQMASSTIGSLNITDVAGFALYIAKLGYKVMDEKIPDALESSGNDLTRKLGFELPYSTHGIRVESMDSEPVMIAVRNTDEDAFSGNRCLSISATPMPSNRKIKIYYKTYYEKEDFSNGRYEPVCSPIAYPGQYISVAVKSKKEKIKAAVYSLDNHTGKMDFSQWKEIVPNEWVLLKYQIPSKTDACIKEIGIVVENTKISKLCGDIEIFLDDFTWTGMADYIINFSKEHNWSWLLRDARTELSQYTRVKGISHIENGRVKLYSYDFTEIYTGDVEWTDYRVCQSIRPIAGDWNGINFRVQGAARSYAAVIGDNRLSLQKNINCKYFLLHSCLLSNQEGQEYIITVEVIKNKIIIYVNNKKYIEYTDNEHPYLKGCIGMSSRYSSLAEYGDITVNPIKGGLK